MHRTQVYLEPDLVAALQRLARQEGTSMGELIRRGARALVQDAEEHEPWGPNDPLWLLKGDIHGGPEDDDVALNVDHYLYGAPRRTDLRVAEARGEYNAHTPA